MTSPRIAILLPFRDARRTLAAAIASMLWQTEEDFALLLLDDGGDDGSRDIAAGFDDPRIALLRDGHHRGLPARLNEGVARAVELGAPLVARMDADDIAHPRRLERQLALLDAEPSLDLVGCGTIVVEHHDRIVGCRRPPARHEEICRTPYRRFPLFHPTWLGRTDWFRRHPYDEMATRSQDYHLLRATFARSRFGNVPDLLLAYDEGTRRLGKAVSARLACARNLWRRGVPRGELVQATVGSAAILAGSLADVAIEVTGRPDLGGLRLARPTDAEQREWAAVLARARAAAAAQDSTRTPSQLLASRP